MVQKAIQTERVKKQTKIQKIEKLYGADNQKVTLDKTTQHLNKIGYRSLGNLLQAK
jgi:hypothetical protein